MMRFNTLLRHPAEWMCKSGPHSDIVISSRIRLARNLCHKPFPGWSKKEDRQEVMEIIRPRVEALTEMHEAFSKDLGDLSSIQKQLLVERHLISREHAAKSNGCATVIDRPQRTSIMINEEDHLRMQTIAPGLALEETYHTLDEIDTRLGENLDYAFDRRLGYLTACPTNLGTGMRASAMVHLPALVLSEQINPVIQAVNKIGLAVRGLYGEGTEALANLFQVSNQNTLGERETEIIGRLGQVIEQIIEHERNARLKLLEEHAATIHDQVGRAYAILRHAHIISSKEALNLLSMLRLGTDLGFLREDTRPLTDLLFTEIQPAHLQISAGRKLDPEQRDLTRAEILRTRLKSLREPDMLAERPTAPETDPEDANQPET
jgi:protein arginine kinase